MSLTTTQTPTPTRWPCLDSWGRYTRFPCHECKTPDCWAGPKPITVRPRPVLRPGEKACAVCIRPFKAYGKGKYCGDKCRKKAIAKQRRARRRREGLGIY